MRKIAVFVEGQSELVTVRNLLWHKFEFQVNFTCLSLYKKGEFKECPYPFAHPGSQHHYYIYNVGNDNSVINEILAYEGNLWNQGFEKIIGLRDMYSKNYRNISSIIDPDLNTRFIDGHSDTINKRALRPEHIHFRFSIMEMEAWILGMHQIFEKIDAKLTVDHIKSNLGYDLAAVDPESYFFKPASNLGEIYNLVGMKYDKKLGDIESICSKISSQDFNNLYGKAVCQSYNDFLDVLI